MHAYVQEELWLALVLASKRLSESLYEGDYKDWARGHSLSGVSRCALAPDLNPAGGLFLNPAKTNRVRSPMRWNGKRAPYCPNLGGCWNDTRHSRNELG